MTLWQSLAEYASFETERLVLRPLTFEDRVAFHELLHQPEDAIGIFPRSVSETDSTAILVELMRQPLGVWALVEKETSSLVGLFRLEKVASVERQAEVGYCLLPAYRGQGLMTEALKAIVALLVKPAAFHELHLITHEENTTSQRVAEKAGFICYRHYKGSDRYSRTMRSFRDYRYQQKNRKEDV